MVKFLTLKTEAFGLDINGSATKIIQLKKRRGFFSVVSWGGSEISPGIIENGEIKDEESLVKIIKESLSKASGEKIDTKHVIASLPEEKSFLQVIQLPKMKENELRSAVFFEAENYIPLPIDQVYLDFQVIDPVVDHLNHIDVLIVAFPRVTADSYASCFKKAGLVPFVFEVESLSMARALVKNEVSNSPLILVDIGENNTCFTAFAGRSIRFTSSIPISSKQLEKKEVKDFSAQIEKYLSFYQDHNFHEHLPENKEPAKIILSGEGAEATGLPEVLAKELKIQVEIGDPLINIPLKKINSDFKKKSLSFAAAIGLAQKGVVK